MALSTFSRHTFTLASLEDTRQLATQLAGAVTPGDVLLLDGPVGAGKTTLTGFLLSALGAESPGQSPSYALHRTHTTPKGLVHHLDLYRLNSTEELESLDPWSVLGEDLLCIVEWPFQVPFDWPKDATVLRLITDGVREAVFD